MQPQSAHELAESFDLNRLERAFLDDPYPTYRALREHDPVHRMANGSYFLTRYDDLIAIYRDAKTWSSDKKIDFNPLAGRVPTAICGLKRNRVTYFLPFQP